MKSVKVAVKHCTCTIERKDDHRIVEAVLIKYEDGTYGRE